MAIEKHLIKTWRHKETKRYVAAIYKDFIDTTKVLLEAYYWDIDSLPSKQSNFRRFSQYHGNVLRAAGFEEATIVLEFDTEKQELIYDIFGKEDCYYDNKRAERASRTRNNRRSRQSG